MTTSATIIVYIANQSLVMGSSIEREVVLTQLQNLSRDIFHISLVEQWIILTSNRFDLYLPNLPPFQSLSVLYNCQTQEFFCRTFARSLERGSFESLEQLAQFAQETFLNKVACIGSGHFPESSVFSEKCTKYVVPSNISDLPKSKSDSKSDLIVNNFRCEYCQKDLKHEPSIALPEDMEIEIKSEISPSLNQLDDLVHFVLDENGSKVDNLKATTATKDDDIADHVVIKAETGSSVTELNDLVKQIKDEHYQAYSLFDSEEMPVNKKKPTRSSKSKTIFYPKNVNHKPRADGKFECEYCGHAVTTRSGKTDHKKLNHGWGHFECELCPSVYKESLDFVRHIMKAHVDVSEALCPRCHKHVNFERNEKVFEGHYSSCVWSHRASKNAKMAALQREKNPVPVKCSCDTCGHVFNNLRALKIHQRIHEGKGFVCKVCGFWAAHRSLLASHRQKHEREQGQVTKLVCPHCGQICLSDSQFANHIERRHRPYQCQQCTEICLGRRLLNIHKSKVHGANRCDACGLCCSTISILQRHKLTHSEPSFSCQFCPRVFTTERYKVNHERTHGKETPFKCQICDYQCKSSGTLSRHKKYKHNGGKSATQTKKEEVKERKISRKINDESNEDE